MAEKKKDAEATTPPTVAPKKADLLRVTIHCPAANGKVFTTMGTLGNGACVNLPAGEARRYIERGLARLTERTEDDPGAPVTVVEDRPVTP